jgi:hypothetical protein
MHDYGKRRRRRRLLMLFVRVVVGKSTNGQFFGGRLSADGAA